MKPMPFMSFQRSALTLPTYHVSDAIFIIHLDSCLVLHTEGQNTFFNSDITSEADTEHAAL